LALLWDEVLHIRKVGVTHSFVELGGDSLNAIRVLPRIAERFHVEITFPELFPRGTVRQLAALITERQRAPEAVPVVDDGIGPATAEELRLLAE
jgi:acyl carrier protein